MVKSIFPTNGADESIQGSSVLGFACVAPVMGVQLIVTGALEA
jgi:hypothetical protein